MRVASLSKSAPEQGKSSLAGIEDLADPLVPGQHFQGSMGLRAPLTHHIGGDQTHRVSGQWEPVFGALDPETLGPSIA